MKLTLYTAGCSQTQLPLLSAGIKNTCLLQCCTNLHRALGSFFFPLLSTSFPSSLFSFFQQGLCSPGCSLTPGMPSALTSQVLVFQIGVMSSWNIFRLWNWEVLLLICVLARLWPKFQVGCQGALECWNSLYASELLILVSLGMTGSWLSTEPLCQLSSDLTRTHSGLYWP